MLPSGDVTVSITTLKPSYILPLSPARASSLAQGFSPMLSTITRQPIELEKTGKLQKIRLG